MTTSEPLPPGGAGTASTQAITALVVGILGIVSCWLLSPVAWYIGSQELKSIREGRSSAAGEVLANVGRILGIVGTILLVLLLIWICLGGFAILMAALNAATSGG